MPNYDFRSLSPIDFEIIVRDLLQEELGVTLESFKSGKDLGIDFRYCQASNNTLIIQCKHYVDSGYDDMLRTLRKGELPKVIKLNPSHYILATSVPLSPPQKAEIMALLSPYIKNPGDIYGRDDLNNLLGKFPRIERQTVKLWLSSVTILEEILQAQVKNISRHEIDHIREHAKVYVQNKSFSEALEILEKFNFCIIAGIPGIGKTILAEMLLLHFSRAGYEIFKISDDIAEAWSLNVPSAKRVFYYDDFLGQTSLAEKLHKNEDQRLIDFLNAVKQTKGVKLILTTREYILNQACQLHEKLDREKFGHQKCIIDLSKYTRMVRAKILFNHIYFSELPKGYKTSILKDRNYLKVIDHRNYNPRIIQLMTEVARIRGVDPPKYIDFFLDNLENPLEIWGHAFKRHLSQSARNMLIVLLSMPYEVFLNDLYGAFQNYNIAYSKKYGSSISPQDFMFAIRELEDDFLNYEKDGENTIVKYHNPSVRDFVKQYLESSSEELGLLIESTLFYEQLHYFWNWKGTNAGRAALLAFGSSDQYNIVSLVQNIVNAPPCRLINMKRGKTIQKERWPLSFEEKALLVISMISEGLVHLWPALFKILKIIEGRIEEETADRGDMANLIERLIMHSEQYEGDVHSFVEKGKVFLLSPPVWADDLDHLCNLMESCPQLFSAEDKIRAQESVRETAGNIVDWDLEPEALREEATALESIANRLGVDIEDKLEQIRLKAEERESEMGEEEEEFSHSAIDSGAHVWCSDDDIASLFSTLLG